MSVRQRRQARSDQPTDHDSTKPTTISSSSAADALVNDLHAMWRDARAEGVSRSEYAECLRRALGDSFARKRQKRRTRVCCCLFDCVWTVFLILVAVALLVVYCDPVNFYVQKNFHGSAYHVSRVLRFAFLRASPYLNAVGLDLTQPCARSNPFVNDSVKCPCIEFLNVERVGVVKKNDMVLLPDVVITDHYRVFAVTNAVTVDRVYGRESLVEYTHKHGSLPSPCMQITDDPNGRGPSLPQEVVQDDVWERVTSKGGHWDLTWHECRTEIPLSTMLPPISFLPEGCVLDNSTLYSLANQWGRGSSFVAGDVLMYDRIVMVVLAGRVSVKLFNAERCDPHCNPSHTYTMMTPGDALVLDRRYWACQTHTWSKDSFIMTTTFHCNR